MTYEKLCELTSNAKCPSGVHSQGEIRGLDGVRLATEGQTDCWRLGASYTVGTKSIQAGEHRTTH